MTNILKKKLNNYFSTTSPDKPTKEELMNDKNKILHILGKSKLFFEKSGCKWGEGLVHFQTATLYVKALVKKSNENPDEF
jgi:hypothetical protein